jgi:hypothetical protein
LKEAQKNIIPSGSTFCHSSTAGSGSCGMLSAGTCNSQAACQKGITGSSGKYARSMLLRVSCLHAGCYTHNIQEAAVGADRAQAWRMAASNGSRAAEHSRALPATQHSAVQGLRPTLGYPPSLFHHFLRLRILMYCLLT